MRVFVLIFALVTLDVALGQTQWDHNGSVMTLSSSGASRVFTYQLPRNGLPVNPGIILFRGKRSGDLYEGTAHIFSSSCGAKPYAVKGQVGPDQRSVVLYGKKPRLNNSCKVVGYEDDVLVFTFIDPNQTAQVPIQEYDREPSTLICLQPVFAEEAKLRSLINGHPEVTIWAAQAYTHLLHKYCRPVNEIPEHDFSEHMGDNCYQYTGIFRNERVFWAACHE